MGLWALGWLILLSRYIVFDLGLLPWKESVLGLFTYQMMIIFSVFLFISATHIYINERLSKWWSYGTAIVALLSLTIDLLSSSLFYKLLLPIYFGCIVCIWIGMTFIWHSQLKGIGRLITGYAYILWSLLNLIAPIILGGSWILPWAHTIGGLLRLFIAIGILIMYFENTRSDLADKENQYRFLAEHAVDVIYSYQIFPKAKIDYLSPSVLQFTGYSPEEYYTDNQLVFTLIHPADLALLENFIQTIPKSTEKTLTLRLLRKDKTTLWVEQKCTPIYDKTDNLTAIHGIIRDITTRKILEKIRIDVVGSMAVAVAHEIRNPITTVRGYLQIMAKRESSPANNDIFKLMIEEIDKADNSIYKYLSLSKEKQANLAISSLNTIIEALYPLLQTDANPSKVSVTLHLDHHSRAIT